MDLPEHAFEQRPGPAPNLPFAFVVKVVGVVLGSAVGELQARGDHPLVVVHLQALVGNLDHVFPHHAGVQHEDTPVGGHDDSVVDAEFKASRP